MIKDIVVDQRSFAKALVVMVGMVEKPPREKNETIAMTKGEEEETVRRMPWIWG